MRVLDDIPVEIDEDSVLATLHLDRGSQYASEVCAMVETARRVARPRALYRAAVVAGRETGAVVLAGMAGSAESSPAARSDGCDKPAVGCRDVKTSAPATAQTRLSSKALRVNLEGVETVFPYVATCGSELDSIPVETGDVLGLFCRDTIKEMVLWAALSHLYRHLTEAFGADALSSMNPGSGEASVWPIEQQRELFAFLGDVPGAIGVVLTPSCLMVPNKSVSGIFYPSSGEFENCQLCNQQRCTHRRAAFDPELWATVCGQV